MKHIQSTELAQMLAQHTAQGLDAPLLLDVREAWEFAHASIAGSTHIPMHSVPQRLAELNSQATVICICHHGARSAQVGMYLEQQGFTDVVNLTGGIDAWSRQVDSTVALY